MKNLLYLASLILIVSCSEQTAVNYAVFSGTIENHKTAVLEIYDTTNEKIVTINVGEDGSFSDTIYAPTGYYTFFDDNKLYAPIFLKNGDDLRLLVDADKQEESLLYEGVGQAENNYLMKKKAMESNLGGGFEELFKMDETNFLEEVYSLKDSLTKAMNSVELNSEFEKIEELNIKYDQINKINQYEDYHPYFAKLDEFEVSSSFPNVMDGISFDDEVLFESSASYNQTVMADFSHKVDELVSDRGISTSQASLIVIRETESQIIKNKFLNQITYYVNVGNVDAEELYNEIMTLSTDENAKEKLTEQFLKIENLQMGKASPKFVDYVNYTGGVSSLDDYLGKYVYIDVWATWCGPCKAEIPFLKDLEELYHEKNIVFVSISVDKENDFEKWRTMIEEKEMGGVQLFADKNWESDFVSAYGINGIPRFILIDPVGNIVSSDVFRPSDPDLIGQFDELGI